MTFPPVEGVFGQKGLDALVRNGRVVPGPGFDRKRDVKSASIDLSITDEVFRIENLLQPSQLEREKIRDLLPLMGAKKVSLGNIAEPNMTYLARANASVNFPLGVYGYLNAKSSSGRNFIFARALADEMHMFDSVDKRHVGYTAEIWTVIQPLAFPIILTNKERYNQLRIFNGDTRFKETDLRALLREHDLLYSRKTQKPYKQGDLSLYTHDGTVLCTLYAPAGKLVGYKAKYTKRPLDLLHRKVDPRMYFEPVYAEETVEKGEKISFVRIEGGYYYLLSTNEMIKVPTTHTAELVALDTRLGFFFTHFAGFFDPGFFGTATLEVFSPHDIVLRHLQPVARFVLERLVAATVSYAKGGNYQGQIETQLPKQFEMSLP